MEGAPSRDACPPPAGRGADFWRQFCAGGRTALLSDISEPFPLRCSELACLDELAFFAGELSNLSESFPSRCSELACRILPRLTQPSRCIPQYFATRISLLAMTHLGDTAVSRYSRRTGACHRTGAHSDRAAVGGHAALAPWLGPDRYQKPRAIRVTAACRLGLAQLESPDESRVSGGGERVTFALVGGRAGGCGPGPGLSGGGRRGLGWTGGGSPVGRERFSGAAQPSSVRPAMSARGAARRCCGYGRRGGVAVMGEAMLR